MYEQINFLHAFENNNASQANLEANFEAFNKSCRKVLKLLFEGVELTVRSAILEHDISSLPRRLKDIEEKLELISGRSFSIPERSLEGGRKAWFLTEKDKCLIEEILNK